jgi:hypothetical protein
MIRNFLFLLLLIFAVMTQLNAQEKSKLEICRKIVVQDSDRRGFDERNSFTLDVDGDGKPDTITPRTYKVKVNRKTSGKTKSKVRENLWITFDIKTSKGRVLNSFFRYNYGTDESVYWVYAFVPCKINGDAKADLLFYSGDDTSDETIILENRGNIFKVRSRKTEVYE